MPTTAVVSKILLNAALNTERVTLTASANLALKFGDWLDIDSSGNAIQAIAANANNSGSTMYAAVYDGPDQALALGTEFSAIRVTGDLEFIAPLSSIDAGGTWNDNLRTDDAMMRRSNTAPNNYVVNINTVANPSVNITGVVPRTESETFPYVRFRVKPAFIRPV